MQNQEPRRRSESAPPSKKHKKPSRKLRVLKKLLSIFVSTLLSIFLICIITGTIVATAATIYVLDFMDEASAITLEDMKMTYNTSIYATDRDGNLITIYEVGNAVQRIPVSIEEIPQHVLDAFIYTEDERFYIHDGVDYKNTIAACLNLVAHFWDSERGGSTITQQLIKNVTGDDDPSPTRKVREVFRAMTLERNYPKDKIMETYLNYIGFGSWANGIELGAMRYFGKNVKDLSVAEGACLAAIPKSPEVINPFASYTDPETGEEINYGRENNRERQEYVLWQMYDHGALTYDEYQAALNEHLIFRDTEEYRQLHPELEASEYEATDKPTTWTIDAAIREVEDYLMEQYQLDDRDEALEKINTGGYQIYTTIDMDMQAYVEEKYLDLNNLIDTSNSARYHDTNGDGTVDENDEVTYPQSAFIAMNYEGEILAVVGALGEKKESLIWNYAFDEPRQPGSTIKPVAGYGCGIYTDEFHWGSLIEDSPLSMPDGPWPANYSGGYSHKKVPVYYGLMRSLNTVSARLVDSLSVETVYNFATEHMGLKLTDITSHGLSDQGMAPLSVGALTYGVTMKNMVNSYIPYGNGGTYYTAHIVKRLEQGNHELIFDNDGHPREAVDPETAFIMNRLMKNVVSSSGTAGPAALSNKQVVGKTGTTENWEDLWFIGLTEDFVSGVWIGYTQREKLDTSISSARLWYNVIGQYANSIESEKTYPECETIIEDFVCTNSGMRAASGCPKGEKGYWKENNAPICQGCVSQHYNNGDSSDDDDDGDDNGYYEDPGDEPWVDPGDEPDNPWEDPGDEPVYTPDVPDNPDEE